ncbi:MAG: adenylate kinase [bacterium]
MNDAMGRNIIIFGPPGAGKGTQSDALKRNFDVFHLSTGDILREAVAAGSETGKLARQYTESGRLVPDDVVVRIVAEKINTIPPATGILFDGFPRTLPQAESLDRAMNAAGRRIERVVSLAVDDERIIQRLEGRRTCPDCKRIYHLKANPPRRDGACDDCGAPLAQRDDDKREVIEQRLKTYHAQTRPVLDYYRERGLLGEVNGDQEPEKVSREILSLFR